MMEEKDRQEKERKFINEKIVPRKRYKKIIAIALGVVFMTVIFGAAIGVAVSLSSRLITIPEESEMETIIIARDEMTQEGTEETTEAETESESESSTEETLPVPAPVPETEPEVTLKSIYDAANSSLVIVTYTSVSQNELLGTENIDRVTNFGAAVAETQDSLFILTDLSTAELADGTAVAVNGIAAEVYGKDEYAQLMILRVNRAELPNVSPLELGNSLSAALADQVYMIGAPLNRVFGLDDGVITYIDSKKDVVDGYEQNIYTDMYREKGGSAVLLDESGKMIGWISDQTCDETEQTAVASGISVLKYLIEDMCSGKETAYIGIYGTGVTETEGETLGIPAGYYVQEVSEGSPAFEGGLQAGDCILSVNGGSVQDSHSLEMVLDTLEPGQVVEVEVKRRSETDYTELTLNVTAGSR